MLAGEGVNSGEALVCSAQQHPARFRVLKSRLTQPDGPASFVLPQQ